MRIAAAGMVRWIAALAGHELSDAHQLVSQRCELRIGNLVNPAFSVCCRMPKRCLPSTATPMQGIHRKLSRMV